MGAKKMKLMTILIFLITPNLCFGVSNKMMCNVVFGSDKTKEYSFWIDKAEKTLFLTDKYLELEIHSFTDSIIIATSLNPPKKNFKYDRQTLTVDLKTNSLKVEYAKLQTEDEKKACRKQYGEQLSFLCDQLFVLQEHSENGMCELE